MGAAIGLLKPGYMRKPSFPATRREPEKGPFFDKPDPKWAPVVREAFERIAGGELPWSVGLWLTEVGLPKAGNCHTSEWTEKNVIALIRRTDYRGFQKYRDTVSKKVHTTGTRKSERNDPEEVLTRELPNMRIVPDWLWYAANAAIDRRVRRRNGQEEPDHPLAGIPRDSRGPLSGIFRCFCGARMNVDGRVEGGYRCSLVLKGKCWNKATSLKEMTHRALGDAIVGQLRLLDDELDRMLGRVQELFDDGGRREHRKKCSQARVHELRLALERLNDSIETAEQPSDSTRKRIEKREEELARAVAELQHTERQDALRSLPKRKQIGKRIDHVVEEIQRMDRSTQAELQLLVGTIQAIPCQQFGSNKVVLRTKFELQLAALLPSQTRAALAAMLDGPINEHFESIPMTVDLFEPSAGPKYGLKALELKEQRGWGPTRTAKELGITKRKVCIALKYGAALREAGLTDPFVELTEPPEAASRWRTHPRFQQKSKTTNR
jgi:hypothetical protein